MRRSLRLLPLSLLIAACLPAWADDDMQPNWGLCPVGDAVPAFPETQPAPAPATDAQATDTGAANAGLVDANAGATQAPAKTGPKLTSEQRLQLPTDISGDQISGIEGSDTTFSGHVVLTRGDQFLATDHLTSNSETGNYSADGSVRYQDSGIRLVAKSAEGNQDQDTHQLDDVRYQLISRRGNGGAERAEMHGSDGKLYGSTYSTCPPDDRRWELRAKQIDIDTDSGMGVAHDATLRVGKVPVLYVPWFTFPIDNRRRTGLLYPTIGSSSRNGFDWRQPIYFNLAPNYDLTLTPRYMSDRGLQLGTEFRYLLPHGRGTLDMDYLPSDKLTDRERDEEIAQGIPEDNRRVDNRGMFRFDATQDLSDHWQARSSLVWISDPRYLEDASNNVNGLTAFRLKSTVGIFGNGRYWQAGISAERPVLADYTLAERNLPYGRLPRLFAEWEQPFGKHFVAGVDTELVRFQHNDSDLLPGGSRFDLKPYVSMPFEGDSWFATPTLAWRYTGYRLDDDLANKLGGNASPSRSLPIASFDAGMYFDRDMDVRGHGFIQTLEPRIFYLYAPYRDQTDLPLFDTRAMTFSWGSLFRDNSFTGADRQTNANQVTVALSSRFLRQSDGFEKLVLNLGQIRYFDPPQVSTNSTIPAERSQSRWVADATYAVNDRWSMNGSYQWDPTDKRQYLASFSTRYLIGEDGVANLGYRYRRDVLEQADLSFLYPINASWSLVGRYYYSFYRNPSTGDEPGLLEGIAGVQWDSCCLAVRVVARRYVQNRSGDMNNAIQFEVELKGLGSGGADTRSRLRRAILGYDRDDLYLIPPASVGVDNDALDDDAPDTLP
ncbi:LPS assembly protein LptD [Pseudoluteimonas lycopersici]|uniref:LPS assembly protein LptD n=1 Tax=Pseudoluteimonas lycopersici TaxID=1324796 RepID=UPI001FE9E4CF|nr:LPS assembly protein LptD [Lysobacter lycopersici]